MQERGLQQGFNGRGENRLWAGTQGNLAVDESVPGRSKNGGLRFTAGSGAVQGSGRVRAFSLRLNPGGAWEGQAALQVTTEIQSIALSSSVVLEWRV